MPYPPLDVTEQWAKTNQTIIDLLGYVPDGKLDWSPQEGLWDLRRIMSHICAARHNWLTHAVRDGEETPNVLEQIKTKDGIREQLERSWARVERWASDGGRLDKVYEGERRGQHFSFSGHWIAYHLLEHDIHHRADVFHYLALLGIEHPHVGTP